ncbi:alpha-2-macroglobulin family protein [Pseudaestuariivita atlantica]|uniref:PAN domain-containing protein n=1 Tax=Pseudaestuariivita atlantica TaxID=1317121 RepID=A0A0L1JPX5_9RHOB|nr:alpha-2-macroglobulin family protein [Pseudaestuariivita atlantica]KNG93824.1 PAN domain-containing protein [Pseudaestuariivita atlantica]
MRRFTWIFSLLAVIAAPLAAQSILPGARSVVSENTDFYGSDLQALFDTTEEACRRTCTANAACVAYTFNRRSNSCFPKSAVTEREAYDGAISVEMVRPDAAARERAKARRAELTFLGARDLTAARNQAEGLGRKHPGGKWTVEVLLDAVRDRREAGNLREALHWQGAALSQTDDAAMWLDYARLARAQKTSSTSEKRRNAATALSALMNGYLRTSNTGLQVTILQEMGEVLEIAGRGRDTIRALRLAETMQPRPEIVAALDAAIGKYGFRIVEHRVESDLALPRLCATFSEPLVRTGVDYTTYVRLPDDRLAVSAEGNQVCVDGVEHGSRYQLTFRAGLPAASGEELIKDVALTLYVRDRSPQARFPSRAYVLPKTPDAGVAIETVNLDTVDLVMRRVSDRNLLRAMQDSYFGRPLSAWSEDRFDQIAEEVWTGSAEVENTLNRTMTTRLPVGEVIGGLEPGIYALTARVPGVDRYDADGATQWFLLSDIGLTSLSGADGLHVFARGLAGADPMDGLEVTLISRANRVLGTGVTDASGAVTFEAGLTRGTGGAAPALITARRGEEDMTFLTLTDPAFDLSDRGVAGNPPAPPIDVFLTTDRGAYRAGETIFATALVRDGQASALPDVPLTAILTRPDGVEYARHVSAEGVDGGHVFDMPTGPTVPRGSWAIAVKADVDAPPLATARVLVEDFVPERIDFDLTLPDGPLRLTDRPLMSVEARYLFGAPGADLPVSAELRLAATRAVEGFPGFEFGRHDVSFTPRSRFQDTIRTDAAGETQMVLSFPQVEETGTAFAATVIAEMSEGSGRPVERAITAQVLPGTPLLGIRQQGGDEVVAEGGTAAFDLIGLTPDLKPGRFEVAWTLNRVRTRYQWYEQYGRWQYEPITTRTKVAGGTALIDGAPITVEAGVDWGRYELVVERTDGPYASASVSFYAGWFAPADASATPDTLELSLDKPAYRAGDTATLTVLPRAAGTALVTVMSNRVIAREVVEVTAGENRIPLLVTEDWGAGAYVTATVIQPMQGAAPRTPIRALGLAYARIDPGEKRLAVSIEAAEETAPRGPLDVAVRVEGVRAGETAHVTLAAVDLGILNLTGFASPDPSDHYFGQRRLGVEFRDLYGRLLDGQTGAMGRLRSGGDGGVEARLQSPPPTEELVAFFSGPVTVGADGLARVSFDMPAFNGTVRLMAVAWSATGVGEAERDVLVRDPVVVATSLPRFLAPGDRSRLKVEITHAKGPAGEMLLRLEARGVSVDLSDIPSSVTVAPQGRAVVEIPVTAQDPGDHALVVTLTTPDGTELRKPLTLPVRANDPEIATTQRFALAAGDTFTLTDDVFAGLRDGTGSATVSAGPLARLDAPGLLQALDRYPYGCTEQVTSQAMPLLYLSSVAEAMDLGRGDAIRMRIGQAVERVLSRQGANGAFGMWRVDSGDLWLDAYVSDFLSRARAQGHAVPDLAFDTALDNLMNQVNYAPDFDNGGQDLAYALMVLAREGRAAMGTLRYYADEKRTNFATPLAAAQIGAALAMYGDQARADMMFAQAVRQTVRLPGEDRLFRADFGTSQRDLSGLLTLAVEHGSTVVDREALTQLINARGRPRSTQEQAWALLAAQAMLRDPSLSDVRVNGQPIDGPFVRVLEDQAMADPLAITNGAAVTTDLTLTTFGVPDVPVPASGYGYTLTRAFYTMDGEPMPGIANVGDRFVAVLTVSPAEKGQARLMVNDALPAGFEIDNPNLIRAGDIRALDWLKPSRAEHTEFRADRFLAAVDKRDEKPITLAYIVRAVSPGVFHHPAATVEDMYLPQFRARTEAGRIEIR